MNDFFNPKSMLTPGAAGTLMMFLANGVCLQFPEITFRYVALALSFLIGCIVFSSTRLKIPERIIYWVLNSLVIFAVGVGSSNIGAHLMQPDNVPAVSMLGSLSGAGLVNTAYAHPLEGEPDHPPPPQEVERLRAEKEQLLQEIRRLEQERGGLEQERRQEPAEPARKEQEFNNKRPQQQDNFFRRW